MVLPLLNWGDILRRVQGDALEWLGLGPVECSYRVVASRPCWRLRQYGGSDARWPLLIVAAPIKRPYIWDMMPATSVIRRLIRRGMHVYLLEWCPPSSTTGGAGLDIYADLAIADCVARITGEDGNAPFLIGHSLGGALAAIYAGLDPQRIRGLVLIGAPVCFRSQSREFRDAVAIQTAPASTGTPVVPGCAISFFSALTMPQTFVWSRIGDEISSSLDPRAAEICARVERWALDEVAVSGLLACQVVQWLYRENRLCRGTLWIRGRTVGPATVRVPTLAVINALDEIAPEASVEPFLNGMIERDVRLLRFAGESGVALQHLALLIGPRAHAEVWPTIDDWLEMHSQRCGAV